MKTAEIETLDNKYYSFDNVTDINETGDFMVIQALHPNGKKESHRVATHCIQRLSYFDKTNVATVEANVEQ